jgi:hypothetical protein
VTGAWGVAMLAFSFTHWYVFSDGTWTMWQAFGVLDLWLGLVALMAIGVPIVTALRESPSVPVALTVCTTGLAILAMPFLVHRLINEAGPNDLVDLAWGAVAGLVCLLGIAVSAWMAMGDERSPGTRPHPEPERMPSPPVGT